MGILLFVFAHFLSEWVGLVEDGRLHRGGTVHGLVGEVVKHGERRVELGEDGLERFQEATGLKMFGGGNTERRPTERYQDTRGYMDRSSDIYVRRTEKVSGAIDVHGDTVILDDVADTKAIRSNGSKAKQSKGRVATV